jgi:iron complex outermembrane receptor protein
VKVLTRLSRCPPLEDEFYMIEMKFTLYFTIWLLLVCNSTFAQFTLSGKITDRLSGKPLYEVNIAIQKMKRHTVSDGRGVYRLKNLAAGTYLVNISLPGYTTLSEQVRLSGDSVRNYSLVPSTNQLNEVVVRDTSKITYRSRNASIGLLGSLPLKDIPFSVNVTSGELIENRNAHTLADALQTNPTAELLMVSNTYSSLSRMMIRGFTAADQDELRDGLVDRSFTLPPIENVERIEVLNGMSGFLYGFSEVGGIINYVSKQPPSSPLANLSIGQYGGGINYIHADLGGTLDTAKRLGYRFNIYREDGGTYIHGGSQARTLMSGVLDYQILPGTHLKADIYQQDYDVDGLQTYFLLPTGSNIVPDAFDPAKQYGQPWTYNESTKTLLGIGLDSKLNAVFKLRAAYRHGNMWRKYSYVDAALLDNLGNYQETYWDSPRQYETTNSSYALVDADFHTGTIFHHITFGYTGNEYYYQRGANISQVLGKSNIDSTVNYAIPEYANGLTTFQGQTLTNILADDRVELNKSWLALLGLTDATITQTAGGTNTGISTSNFTQRKLTPGFGLVFKPDSYISAYASYTESLTAGGTAPVTAVNANQQLPPDVGNQYEAGVKATAGNIDLTAALFRIDEVNEYLDAANVYTQDGREVHKGLEVTATGKLLDRLTFVGGFTLLNARIANTNTASIEGKIPLDVPEQYGRAYLEYTLPGISRLIVSGGANYNGQRPVNSTNTAFLPSSTTIDAGLRYTPDIWNHRLSGNINLSNVFNKAYWINYRSGDGLESGTPRILSFSLKVSI